MANPQTPIDLDELSAPARRALMSFGYVTLEQLAAEEEATISALHGVGNHAIGKLRAQLASHDLSFRESPRSPDSC